MNKNISFIMPHFFFENKGGAELQTYYLAKELIYRGWNVNYFREKSSMNFRLRVYEGIKLYTIYIPKFLLHPRLLFIKQILRRFQLFIYQKKIYSGIIYNRADESYLPLFKNDVSNYNFKLIWACSHDDKLKNFYWSKKYGKRIHKLIFNKLNELDLILLQTEFQKKLLFKNFGLTGKVLYNSHPLPKEEDFHRQNIVVWVGRLHKRKYPERFLSIVKRMKNHKDISFIMIGKKLSTRYDTLIKSTILENSNFHFYGESNQEFILQILKKAKLLVNTSDTEGFSNTFIEAWLRGVPVISLSGVNPDNLIKKKSIGFVCENLEEIQNQISKVINDDALFTKMSNKSKKIARDMFDIKKYADNFINIINELY